MKINAYILAADPAWIEASISSYVNIVDQIIVSYDENGKSWSGTPIAIDECLRRLKAMNCAFKMRFCPGHFARSQYTPMENDTYQRQCALDEASRNVDWVLQLDTDEILPHAARFKDFLASPNLERCDGLLWPMRTFFGELPDGRFLEICDHRHHQLSSFPGPVAVKSGCRLRHARQAEGQIYRCEIASQSRDPADLNALVHHQIAPEDAIIHMSWVRDAQEMQRKLGSWGHSGDLKNLKMLRTWEKAQKRWFFTRNFHPLNSKWWPALRPTHLEGVWLIRPSLPENKNS